MVFPESYPQSIGISNDAGKALENSVQIFQGGSNWPTSVLYWPTNPFQPLSGAGTAIITPIFRVRKIKNRVTKPHAQNHPNYSLLTVWFFTTAPHCLATQVRNATFTRQVVLA